MLKRPAQPLKTQNFLKSSSLFYLTNIFIAGLNYLIVIIVSFQLSEQLATWTALAALIMIFFSIVRGLTTPIAKSIAVYAEEQSPILKSYYRFARAYILKLSFPAALLPILVFLLVWLVGASLEFNLYVLVGLTVFCYLQFSIENQFLLSTLQTKPAVYVALALGLGRFIFTLILILLGFSLYALPLGYILGYLLAIILAKKYINSFQFELSQESFEFSLKKDLVDSTKVLISLVLLSLALNVDIILADRLLPFAQADLFAVLSNFGQIVFFGSTAFMNMFVAYAARSKDLKTYWQSLAIVTVLSLSAGLVFWLFEDFVLTIFNRPQYAGHGDLIALYAIFITLYNIVFVSINYLVSKSNYLPIWWFSLFVIINIILLSVSALQGLSIFGSIQVLQFVWINILTIGLAALFLVITISLSAKSGNPINPSIQPLETEA